MKIEPNADRHAGARSIDLLALRRRLARFGRHASTMRRGHARIPVREDQLQRALFEIAQVSRETESMDRFYSAIHATVGELMNVSNFFIAEHDADRNVLRFPYFVDQYDKAAEGLDPGRGLTAYVLRTGQPLLATPDVFQELVRRGEVESVGAASLDWLGVPLRSGDRTWGVIGTQTYDPYVRFTRREMEILTFVAQHVASAIEHKRKEEALRESEERYRQMFENNRAVQWVIDPATGRIIDANMAACDFYGYSHDELCSMRVWDINVMTEDAVRAEMNNAAQQHRSYFIFRHMLASGDVRDVEVHSGPIIVGGRRHLYSIIHDITERRRAEQALKQSEEKYRNIFDFAPLGIYQSTEDGRIVTANTTLAALLGHESADALSQKNLIHDLCADPLQQHELLNGRARRLGSDQELLWRRRDGSTFWVRVNEHLIEGNHGAPLIEGFVADVTERRAAEDRLRAANAQRKAVLDAATRVAIIATDAAGLITMFNSGAERMLGFSAAEMIGNRNLLDLYFADELTEHARQLAQEFGTNVRGFEALATRAASAGLEEREWNWRRRDSAAVSAVVAATSLRDDRGGIAGFLFVATDVTERKHAEELLRKQSAAITASMDGIGILDHRLEFTYANDALAKLYGFRESASLVGRQLASFYEEHAQQRLEHSILPAVRQRGQWRGEADGLRRDGSLFPQEMSLTMIDGGGMVCVVRDVTERSHNEEQIKHLAYHDALTDLPNRLLFKDRLTVAVSHAQRDHSRLAVLFLDLDRFKIINDSLGHNVGDQLLQAVAARIRSCIRESDTVARLGGDEFIVMVPDLLRSEDAAVIAEKILEAIRHPFHFEGREFFTTTSVGISLFPEDGSNADTLIKNADTAMYQAKELGRDNYQLFNAFVNAKAMQRVEIENGLRRALANGDEMVLHYQPIFDFRSGKISGMEALLRWTHPELGEVPPAQFIPLAESIGAMVPIGMRTLQLACEQAKAWHDAGFRDLSLAVNLSVVHLQQPDLVKRVQEILRSTGLPPRLLELEITESSAMNSPETSVRTLYDLKKLGVRISLDDFGTGHSSLSYLKRFPVDTLKIDQSFVRDIISDPDTAAIVNAIIEMAHSLRLKVIAEGVEYREQAEFLKRHACDQMQGFLITPPVPPVEFFRFVTGNAVTFGAPANADPFA